MGGYGLRSYGYGLGGYYGGDYGKREAEAEPKAAADPYYYGGYGYGGYGLRSYGYGLGGYYGGYYGKREAEAVPKAAADPYYYGGYGYGGYGLSLTDTDLVATTVATTESVRLRL